MRLTLRVTPKANVSMAKLIAEMCSLNLNCMIDMADREIVFEKAADDIVVSTVIEAVEEAFDITKATIDAETSDIETVEPTESEAKEKEKTEPESELISDETTEQTGLDLKGESEEKDDLEANDAEISGDSVQFVKFCNKEIEEQINNLLRTIYGVVKYKGADDKDICKFIMTTKYEILSKYAPQRVYFHVGDIVDCNFGQHLSGEISGGHIHALIAYVDEETLYAIPITKITPKSEAKRYLPFTVNDGVKMYDSPDYKGGTLLLCKGGFINAQRIRGVIGNVTEEFLDKILKALPASVDFYNASDISELTCEGEEKIKSSEKYPDSSKDTKTKKITKFEYLMQNANMARGVKAVENLAVESSIETKAEVFLDYIGFPKDEERIAINAFAAASNVKKITWSEVLGEVRKTYDVRRINIKDCLQTMFNKWAENNTAIKKDYPNMAVTEIMKFFVKVISK